MHSVIVLKGAAVTHVFAPVHSLSGLLMINRNGTRNSQKLEICIDDPSIF